MKKSIHILVVLGFLAAGGYSPSLAQNLNKACHGSCDDETVILFRSFHEPDVVPDPSIQWCRDHAPFDDPPIEFVPDEAIATLGATFSSMWVGFWNGEVIIEKVRQLGTAQACGYILEGIEAGAISPFYIEGTINGIDITAEGECIATLNAFGDIPPTEPPEGPVFAGCALNVVPDASEPGIKWGIATSNSVLVPIEELLPDFQTGSFWTLHLYWE